MARVTRHVLGNISITAHPLCLYLRTLNTLVYLRNMDPPSESYRFPPCLFHTDLSKLLNSAKLT